MVYLSRARWVWVRSIGLVALPLLVGCGSSDGPGGTGARDRDASVGDADGGDADGSLTPVQDAAGYYDSGSDADGGMDPGGFDLDTLTIVYDGPESIDLVLGEPIEPVTFRATVNGRPISVGWSVDRGELASIDENGVLTPTGALGGYVTVRAGLNDHVVTYRIQIRVRARQNGASAAQASQVATSEAELTVGGGIGGVGGEGLGTSIDSDVLRDLLEAGPTVSAQDVNLELLYPYDGTLFPRGLLAPLLMWRWDQNDADAIRIELRTASGNYAWTGMFGPPAVLAEKGRKFIRHPIPQDVWDAATQSAGDGLSDGTSDTLALTLTIAKGGVVYGPVTRTLAVAPGRLTGTVYYSSYGTALATNYNSVEGQPNDFGAAVLSIRSGETGPSLVSGYDSVEHDGCRACHRVSAQATNLLVQSPPDDLKSWWNALDGSPEIELGEFEPSLAWAGLSPDGQLALTNSVDMSRHNTTVSADAPWTRLFDMTKQPPTQLDAVGLPNDLRAALPTFAPDGTKVAFAFLGGSGPFFEDLPTDGSKLVVMDFARSSLTFSNPRVVATGNADNAASYRAHGAGFPSIGPNGERVVFVNEVRGAGPTNETYIASREGARSELWWASTASEVSHPLHRANGRDVNGVTYLPKGGQRHGTGDADYDDSTLNYEPTINPVTTGGYAWVVFTSRRMYGNLATQDPWLSDPRNYDFRDYDQVTTKKLWVAAIQLDAPADSDPSFPAFYLPGQELVAGNAHGFWVLDPCREDGASCDTGDQCCGGYCQPAGPGGALVCADKTITENCSAEQERCDTAADCCDPTADCINNFCARPAPPIVF